MKLSDFVFWFPTRWNGSMNRCVQLIQLSRTGLFRWTNAWVGILALFFFSMSQAANPVLPQEVDLYDRIQDGKKKPDAAQDGEIVFDEERDRDRSLGLLRHVRDGQFGEMKDLSAEARVVWKTDRRVVVKKQRQLRLAETGVLDKGWMRRGNFFYANSQDQGTVTAVAQVPTELVDGEQLLLSDYDELWIDFAKESGLNVCGFSGRLSLSSSSSTNANPGVGLTDAVFYSPGSASPIFTLYPDRENWRERDATFLVNLMFGTGIDKNWRYVQEAKTVVLQRRLAVPFEGAEFLDLGVEPGVAIERVNLVVGVHGRYGRGEVIEISVGKGQHVRQIEGMDEMRLGLKSALESKFQKEMAENRRRPNTHRLVLKEIFVFVSGDVRSVIEHKPIRRIVFQGVGSSREEGVIEIRQPFVLTPRIENVNGDTQRLVVDLRTLVRNRMSVLQQAKLDLYPSMNDRGCELRVNAVGFVRLNDEVVPHYVTQLESWTKRLGGPFSNSYVESGKLEGVGILGFLPFSGFSREDGLHGQGRKYAISFGEGGPPRVTPLEKAARGLPVRIVLSGKSEELKLPEGAMRNSGAQLSAVGGTFQAEVRNDLLQIDGDAKILKIDWPLHATLDERSRFFLGLDDPTGKQITGIALVLYDRYGTAWRRVIRPNRGETLEGAPKQIQRSELLISISTDTFNMNLREAVLFSPSAMEVAAAGSISIPSQLSVAPKPTDISSETSLLDYGAGHITVSLPSSQREEFSFRTALPTALERLQQLRLGFNIPAEWIVGDGCLVDVDLLFKTQKISRRLCFVSPTGEVSLTASDLAIESSDALTRGGLESVQWRVVKPANASAAPSITLNFSFAGWGWLSAEERLLSSPLFFLRGRPVLATEFSNRGDRRFKSLRSNRLSLDKDDLQRLVAYGAGKIVPEDNEWFTLEKIVLQTQQAISWEKWLELTAPPARILRPTDWLRLVMWAAVGVFALFVWRRRERLHRVANSWTFVRNIISLARWVADRVWRFARRLTPSVNLAVGLFGVPVAVLYSGTLGWGWPGVSVVIAAIAMAIGAWGATLGEDNAGREVLTKAALTTIGVCVLTPIIVIAYRSGTENILWSLLPLISAAYIVVACFVSFDPAVVVAQRDRTLALLWTVVAGACYGLGIATYSSKWGNNFFILGGILLVIALHYTVWWLRPLLSNFAPSIELHVFRGGGSVYFHIAGVMLVVTALIVKLGIQVVAEQAALVVYFSVAAGIIFELRAIGFVSQILSDNVKQTQTRY